MFNNYFSIEKKMRREKFGNQSAQEDDMALLVSAVAGGTGKQLVITITTKSTGPTSGTGFIRLESEQEIMHLINALQSRLNGDITISEKKKLPKIVQDRLVQQ